MTQPAVPATVIGASGYVGTALLQSLQLKGRSVLAPARGREHELEGLEVGDLFYCAGLTADYASHPAATAEAHIGLLGRLLERLRPRRVVYLSSTRLFDSQPGAAVSDTSALWLNPLNPRHLYDLTKAAGESLCLAMAGERARIARLSCVWSLDAQAPGFLPGLLRQLQGLPGGASILVTSQPALARHYIHLQDVVAALIAMAEAEDHPPITSLASASDPTTNGDLAACLESLLNCQIQFQPASLDPPPPPPPSLDLSHLARLPIVPPLPLFSQMRQLLAPASAP